jgi:hypothetical protein
MCKLESTFGYNTSSNSSSSCMSSILVLVDEHLDTNTLNYCTPTLYVSIGGQDPLGL